jgi:hypothetical protein
LGECAQVATVLAFVGILVTDEIESLVSHLGAYKSEAHKLELQINDLLSSFQLNITQAEGYVESAVTNMAFREYRTPIHQVASRQHEHQRPLLVVSQGWMDACASSALCVHTQLGTRQVALPISLLGS